MTENYRSIPDLFVRRCAETPNTEAYRFPVGDTWESMTWQESLEKVRGISSGLKALGLEHGQSVSILCSTRIEWVMADLGILCSGAATTTIYPTSTPEDCVHILADSGSVVVFAEEDAHVAMLREHRADLPNLKKVIAIDAKSDGDWVIGLSDLEKMGGEYDTANPDAFDKTVESVTPEDLATLIYTSGTTGKPKGVRLVHECWTYEAEAIDAIDILKFEDLQYLWLPLSHVFAKVLEVAQIKIGFPTAIDGRIPMLVENLGIVRPTFMAAAPRIFEKVHNKVVGGAKEAGGLKYKIFRWAIGVGKQVSALRQQHRKPTGMLAFKFKIADKLVFSKLKAKFGGRVRLFISGSAPLSKSIAEFFHAADILILEGYGLTETSAASFVNRLDTYRFGTVGLPFPGTEVRLAEEDGEVQIRSKGVMRGYHNLPEVSTEVFTEDGWFKTGDIGELDKDGLLRITDRKKDLIKTSGGKYIAPQALEGELKVLCPYVSQVLVHGDRRNFCTALITLDAEAIQPWAEAHQMGSVSYKEIVTSDSARQMVQGYVDKLNVDLARYETIKNFAVLPKDLTIEEGDLTPSLKVKRKLVEKRYMDVLNSMYEESITDL